MSSRDSPIVPDPCVWVGPYQVLAQTTGRFAARDTRLDLAANPVYTDTTVEGVVAWCLANEPAAAVTKTEQPWPPPTVASK